MRRQRSSNAKNGLFFVLPLALFILSLSVALAGDPLAAVNASAEGRAGHFLLTVPFSQRLLDSSISCGQIVSGTIATPTQQDSYTFSGNAGEVVRIVTHTTSGTLSPYLRIYDPTGHLAATFSLYSDYSLPSSGTYTLLLADLTYTNTGSYVLNLQFATGRCAIASLDCGHINSGNITSPVQQDVYTFSGNAGEVVRIVTHTTSGTLSPYLRIYDPTGHLAATFSLYSDYSLPSSGTYTLLLADLTYTNTGSYVLNLQFATGRCAIAPLGCGQTTTGNIASPVQQDVYVFNGNAGKVIRIVTHTTSGTLSPYLRIYDPTGHLAASFSLYSDFTPSSSGTYTLLIADLTYTNTGSYDLGLSGDCPNCTFSLNPTSHSFETAGGTGNVTVTVSGACSWTAMSNVDWITITSGSSGTGSGTVGYTVAANSGSGRTGTLTIAGQTFTVTQTSQSLPDIILGLGRGAGGWLEIQSNSGGGYTHSAWIQVPWADYNNSNGETRPTTGDMYGDGRKELIIGLGPGSGGWIEIRGDAASGYAHSTWIQVPWPNYDSANGETFVAAGDLDGDGRDELVIGLGTGGSGWLEIRGDATTGYAHLAWIQVDWPSYNASNGATHPAVADLNGDGRGELAIGFGSGAGGWVEIRGNSATGYAHQAWIQVSWPQYDQADGETFVTAGDVDGDGRSEIVLGLSKLGNPQGWIEVLGNSTTGYAHQVWIQSTWSSYNSSNGETHPAAIDLDGDGKCEIVIGLGSGAGGWVETLGNASTHYAHGSWILVPWSTYDSANGSTTPAR